MTSALHDPSQNPFKTSHVTWQPSLKCLLGIQVQLLSLWMGNHQILQNCSQSLRLNSIFEITNEIWQQLTHKCCLFCSNSVKKRVFLRLDQPVRSPQPGLLMAAAVMRWLYQLVNVSFAQKAGLCSIERPYWEYLVLNFSPFKTIRVTRLGDSIVFAPITCGWPGRALLRLRKQQANQKRGAWILIRQAKIDLF